MDIFTDVAFLSRLQFTLIVAFHFVFVPLSIGLGLIFAISSTRYYCSQKEEDKKAVEFWLKIFTTSFAIGVASGIAMEFSFGTNWADYSRFVGDIFGAPLAAEALFAFFLESVFLGVVLFGRNHVSRRFYLISSWLVWAGSCLSALWILIANSWMQTPAGAVVSADGSKAQLVDFFAAAFNPTTGVRYFHVITAAFVLGGLIALSIAAYHYFKGKQLSFAKTTFKTGAIISMIATLALFVSAHSTALSVWNEQPTKLAAMEGQYETEPVPLYLFGWVDEHNETVSGLAIPGMTSFLATGSPSSEYSGINELSKSDQFDAFDKSQIPINGIFQVYHLMVALSGILAIVLLLVLLGWRNEAIKNSKLLQKVLIISPIFPILAVEAGWFTAELGRQPWVVYPSNSAPIGLELLTNNAYSSSVTAPELWTTIVLFCAIYAILFIAFIRLTMRSIKQHVQGESISVLSDIEQDLDDVKGFDDKVKHSKSDLSHQDKGGE